MADISIQLGELKLKTPFIAASGTFGYGSEYSPIVDLNNLGAVVTKSLSVLPREGNPPPRIWETAAGMLNAIGLENCGLESFIEGRVPDLEKLPTKVLVNVVGNSIEEYAAICARLDSVACVAGFEINISCPNVKHGCQFASDPRDCERLMKALRPTTKKLLMAKLSPNVTDIAEIARAAAASGADALSLINTLLGIAVDVKTRGPRIANVTGGLSGPCIKPVALRCVYQAAKACPQIPIVGIGGIRTLEDALEFFIVGASAVQIGTTNYFDPDLLNRLPRELEAWCKNEHVSAIKELVGTFSERCRSHS
ncbi:MAG TPA: dihydroorotate dehydrogenase [Planctomycetota bacterium]|nr:dihydroorotate dehydrogenase [Planctomycetota bacterium]